MNIFTYLFPKSHKQQQIYICLLSFFSIIFFCICTSLAYGKEAKTIPVKVGIFDFEQFYGQDENGNLTGYGYAYLESLSRYGNFDFQYVTCSWGQCLEMLKNNEIDLLNSAQFTEERAKDFAFSKYATGISFVKLFVKTENNSIAYNDFVAMNNIKVGLLKGNSRNIDFYEFAKFNDFSTINIEYNDTDALVEALQMGEVDAIVSSNLRKNVNEKPIARFAPMPYYIITNKSYPELKKAVDKALELIFIDNPTYNEKLYDKYYADESTFLILTNEEQEFLKNLPPLEIVFDSYWAPFEFYDTETQGLAGINADIFELVVKKTGIKYNLHPHYDYQESIDLVSSGKVDMLLSYDNNPKKAKELGIVLSDTFLSTPLSIIGKQYTITPQAVFAIPKIYPVPMNFIKEHFPENKIIVLNNIEECYEAILNGEADFTMENFYAVTDVLHNNAYSELVISSLVTLMDNFSFAFRKDIEPKLVNIFNKTISTFNESELNSLLLHYSITKGPQVDLNFFFTKYKTQIIVLSTLIVCLIIIVLSIIVIMQVRNKKALWEMAYIDPLTGAGNLYKFKIDAQNLLKQNPNTKYICTKFDIENFKLINEITGFAQGDKLIQAIAERLKSNIVKGKDTFCRLNNDNFIALKSYVQIEQHKKAENDFDLAIREVGIKLGCLVKCKYGSYEIQTGENDIASILEKVTYAHSLAKNSAGMTTCIYDNFIHKHAIQQKMIENKMEYALKNNQFQLFLQPKFYLVDETLAGAEALVRWIGDNLQNTIYPNDFIPLFEKNGFITKLDMYMLDLACQTIRTWLDEEKEPIIISVNFSRLHLANPNFVQELCATTDKYQIPRHYIELELTESTMFNNETTLLSFLKELHDAGFMLSMDDFGTGYSSLGLLKNIPIDIVKIDRSFFTNTDDPERSKTVIENVIRMAHALNIYIVAEGVETQENVDLLRELHCDMVQGYYYSKPIPVTDFTINYITKKVEIF